MQIGVYGSGYLGTVISACLADFGIRPLVVYNDASIAATLIGASDAVRSALVSKRSADVTAKDRIEREPRVKTSY